MSDLDLKLLGGKFMTTDLPPELTYLHRYFRSELPRMFVSYYLTFGSLINDYSIKFFLDNFIDHTGYSCSEQRLRYLLKRLQSLLAANEEARMNFDFDKLEIIKSGKYKVVS